MGLDLWFYVIVCAAFNHLNPVKVIRQIIWQ